MPTFRLCLGSSYSVGSSISKQCVTLGKLLHLWAPAFLGKMRGRALGPFLSSDGPEPPASGPCAHPLGQDRKWFEQSLWIWDLGCDQPGLMTWHVPS